MTIRALIADDEPLGRARLIRLLADVDDVTVVGECRSGTEVIGALRTLKPDLAFLDVRMPGLDGFGVLEALGPDDAPAVVFVTAYHHYAIRAFDVEALDYLLKPVARDRLLATLERVRARRGRAPHRDRSRESHGPDRLVIRHRGRVAFVPVDEIDWIEADDNNVCLHAGGRAWTMRETMRHLETRLDATRFIRIHRSTIINLDRVKEIQPWFHGEYVVLLLDGTRLTSGRRYRDRLARLIRPDEGGLAKTTD